MSAIASTDVLRVDASSCACRMELHLETGAVIGPDWRSCGSVRPAHAQRRTLCHQLGAWSKRAHATSWPACTSTESSDASSSAAVTDARS